MLRVREHVDQRMAGARTREYPDYAEIVSARAEIRLRDSDGVEHVVTGETLESSQAQRCEDRRCEPLNVWRQDDRFVVATATLSAGVDRRIDAAKLLAVSRKGG